MLASDAERDRVVTRLGDEAVAGRLTVDELEARVAAALGARTRRDLARTQRGLPRAPRPPLDLLLRVAVVVAAALWLLTVLLVLVVVAVTRYLVAQHRAADRRPAVPRG